MKATSIGITGLKPTPSREFVVPPIIQETPLVPSKEASEQAFYAASTYSDNPIQDFTKAKTDLEQTGTSDVVDSAKTRWAQEQDINIKDTISKLVSDPTIDKDLKKGLLQGYALTGYVSKDLKDKYIQKTAARDLSITQEDQHSQDIVIDYLDKRVQRTNQEFNKSKIEEGNIGLTEILKGIGGVGSSLLMSIPAGAAGIYQLITEKDPAKAASLIPEIQAAGYMPADKGSQHVMEKIANAAEVLGIPAKWLGEKALTLTGSPGVATAVEIGLDPINFIPLGKLGSVIKKEIKGTPHIPEGSVGKVTEAANPIVAEKLGTNVIADPTGKIADAIGTDKGAVVYDWVLPKIMSEKDALGSPDLRADIAHMDESAKVLFNDMRYDPNIIQTTKREEEVTRIKQIQEESRSPYYQQSASKWNETDAGFEFKSVYGRKTGGYTSEKATQNAYESLKAQVDQLPVEERGTLSIVEQDGQKYIIHENKKKYDDLSLRVFGPDSISVSVLGMDMSNFARSPAGRWFFPTGRLPEWVQKAAARGIERSARIRDDFTKEVRNNIATTKYGKELNILINEAEEKGIEAYSKAEIQTKFPILSTSAVDDLFSTHMYWRRLQQYSYNWINREQRHHLVADNMQGIYDKAGNYKGAATEKITASELSEVKEVWNFDHDNILTLDAQLLNRTDKKIIRLAEPIDTPNGRYTFGIIGEKHTLDILPTEVIPRIPGWSTRRVKENFFVDVIPKSFKLNGKVLEDAAGLRDHAQTKAAARSEREGYAIAEELKKDYPEEQYIISVRPERQDNWGQVITDYGIHQEMFKHSMKRGEKLPSLSGEARYEDRLHTLNATINSMATMNAFRAWETSFRNSFTKSYSKFTQGEFPTYAIDIKPLQNMDKALKADYDTAHALFKYFERMKNIETLGDFYWKKIGYYVADILESWHIPSGLIREVVKKGEPIQTIGKKLATMTMIHLSPPPRQWLVQTAQQWEMMAIDPTSVAKSNSLALVLKMYYSADARMVTSLSAPIKDIATKTGMALNKDFIKIAEAIRSTGLLQSVDMNTIVHGVFREADRALLESNPEVALRTLETALKTPVRVSRAVGFDVGELHNRLSLWLQMKDQWIKRNPDKDWNTKEAIEEISYDSYNLSGHMSRASMLPYQEGFLSMIFQFASINQNLLMNVIQDNATKLTPLQRTKLAAIRIPLYGAKYGLPGGVLAYTFINNSKDEEVRKNEEIIKRGLMDYTANKMIATLIDPTIKSDMAVSKILSPYSEHFLPYFDVMVEAWKMFDKDLSTNPRIPSASVFTAFSKTVDDMQGWWVTRKVTDENIYKQMAFEAAEMASGFSSYSKGMLMLGMKDQVTRNGNKLGMQYSTAEVYAKMVLGVSSYKEADEFEALKLISDMNAGKKEMAKDIHQQLMNQRTKIGEKDFGDYIKRLNSFISLMPEAHFSHQDKLDVMDEIAKLDRNSYTTLKQSIFMDYWKHHEEKLTQERVKLFDILRNSQDENTQKFVKSFEEGKL